MKLYTKLFLSFSVLFIVLMLSVSIFQYIREKNYRIEQLNSRLSSYNSIIYHSFLYGDRDHILDLVELLPDSSLRVTIIDHVGNVVFDTSCDSIIQENHLHRQEIISLSKSESAFSIHRSSVDGIEYYYFAQRFNDVFIRTALPYNVSLVSALNANMDFLYFFAIAILVVMFLIYLISEKLSTAVKVSEQMQRRKLTQNIAHELKTPIAAIKGYSETLLNNPEIPIEQQKYFIERTFNQSCRLSALLEDISILNKLNDCSKLYEKKTVDVVAVIYDVLKDTENYAKKNSVVIEMKLPPDIIIKGNKSLLYSIFRNLVDNSIAYAGVNSVLKIIMTHSDPLYYYFTVKDNGLGIPQEHLSHIFDRFYRVDKGRSRKVGGTGLGLSIVKNAVAFHKGNIVANVIPEGGLEFLFSLHK